MAFWKKKKLTITPSGEPNFYSVLDGNQWIAVVQLNGEYKLYTQRLIMEKVAEAIAKIPLPSRS